MDDIEHANCFLCVVKDRQDIRIEGEPVYAALCGHATCTTQTFHGLCLMEFRDHFAKVRNQHGSDTPPILIAIRVLREVSR